MALPIQAESMIQLQQRYAKALERVFDADKIGAGDQDRPGMHRENVFDFPDGLRMIVSKDIQSGRQFLHISGSSTKKMETQALVMMMIPRFVELRQEPITGRAHITVSDGGVVHLLFADQDATDPTEAWKLGG